MPLAQLVKCFNNMPWMPRNLLIPASFASHRRVPRNRILSMPFIAPKIFSPYNASNVMVVSFLFVVVDKKMILPCFSLTSIPIIGCGLTALSLSRSSWSTFSWCLFYFGFLCALCSCSSSCLSVLWQIGLFFLTACPSQTTPSQRIQKESP